MWMTISKTWLFCMKLLGIWVIHSWVMQTSGRIIQVIKQEGRLRWRLMLRIVVVLRVTGMVVGVIVTVMVVIDSFGLFSCWFRKGTDFF